MISIVPSFVMFVIKSLAIVKVTRAMAITVETSMNAKQITVAAAHHHLCHAIIHKYDYNSTLIDL